MRLSIKYKIKPVLNAVDIGIIATEICRLKTILRLAEVDTSDQNLMKLRMWDDHTTIQ